MSDFIDIGLVKTHLRVVHARDDKYIELLTKAALNSVLDFIDFKDLSAVKEKWGEVPENLIFAALLMIGDMYTNRSDVIVGTIVAVNPTTERLMLPCRNMGV